MAQVVSIRGTAFVVGLDGQTRPLKVGDKIQKGETIVTSAGGGVELAMDDGRPLSLGAQQTVKVDESLTATARPTPAEGSVGSGTIDSVQVQPLSAPKIGDHRLWNSTKMPDTTQ